MIPEYPAPKHLNNYGSFSRFFVDAMAAPGAGMPVECSPIAESALPTESVF